MQRLARPLVFVSLASALGCTAPAPVRDTPARGASDKAALFGDPSLVPTRHGERVRREIALAQEIEQALAVLPSVARARVHVDQVEPTATPRVLAVVAGGPESDATALAARVKAIAHAVIGPAAAVEVVMEPAPAPPAGPERGAARWPLLLGVLGLGFFAGMLLERIRGLRRPGAVRRRP